MKRTRSKVFRSAMRAMKSWRIVGIEPRAIGPTARTSIGTVRQPMTFWLWYRTMSVSMFICSSARIVSRERKHCTTP